MIKGYVAFFLGVLILCAGDTYATTCTEALATFRSDESGAIVHGRGARAQGAEFAKKHCRKLGDKESLDANACQALQKNQENGTQEVKTHH